MVCGEGSLEKKKQQLRTFLAGTRLKPYRILSFINQWLCRCIDHDKVSPYCRAYQCQLVVDQLRGNRILAWQRMTRSWSRVCCQEDRTFDKRMYEGMAAETNLYVWRVSKLFLIAARAVKQQAWRSNRVSTSQEEYSFWFFHRQWSMDRIPIYAATLTRV